MRLRIHEPSERFLDTEVVKVVAESPKGYFCVLPRHVDMVTVLVPGILYYGTDRGEEHFLAVNGGIMVKQDDEVSIATTMAVSGELGFLKSTVERLIHDVDEKEKKARTSLAKLEADFVRRFIAFGKDV